MSPDAGGPDGSVLPDAGVVDAPDLDANVTDASLVHDADVTFDACIPRACEEANCENIDDGCGGTLLCGTCSGADTCGGSGMMNICGCTPETDQAYCARIGTDCGVVIRFDNCGTSRSVNCGTCAGTDVCGGGGANVCGTQPCDPQTCQSANKNCGEISDGCGATVSCGTCTGVDSCGGGGVANVCGCTPESDQNYCAGHGADCGELSDFDTCGAARSVKCGSCTGYDTCGGGGAPNTCDCRPKTCTGEGKNCGEISDGCGATIACGTCSGADVCGNEFVGTANVCNALDALVEAGEAHTCAVLTTGKVRCWGNGSGGQLGYGNTANIGDDEYPFSVGDIQVGGTVVQVSAGRYHTCVVITTGKVRCWGQSSSGQLGHGNTASIGDDELPSSAGDVPVGGSVVQVSAGMDHTCVVLTTGKVRCWGQGSNGQLGYGNTASIGDDELPSSAGDLQIGGAVVQVSAGERHTCAVLTTGTVRCWGFGSNGQLGYGNTTSIGDNEHPFSAGDVQVGGAVLQVSVGIDHTCALLMTGKVRCWGYGSDGRLGYGNTASIGASESPSSAGDIQIGGAVLQISAGNYHTCAVLTSGKVRCWGGGAFGQLGYGDSEDIGDDEVPSSAGDVQVGGDVVQVSANLLHTCALLMTGKVRCWGYGSDGRLGYASTVNIGDDESPSSAGDVPFQ